MIYLITIVIIVKLFMLGQPYFGNLLLQSDFGNPTYFGNPPLMPINFGNYPMRPIYREPMSVQSPQSIDIIKECN